MVNAVFSHLAKPRPCPDRLRVRKVAGRAPSLSRPGLLPRENEGSSGDPERLLLDPHNDSGCLAASLECADVALAVAGAWPAVPSQIGGHADVPWHLR